jgi:hypothetical protein
MASFILHSKSCLPRKSGKLLCVVLAVWIGSALYSVYLNPEVRHYAYAETIKDAWARKMTQEYGSKIVAVAGSSTEFSIDGQRMIEKYRLPMVNYGLAAGIGPSIIMGATLSHLRPGDTLVLGFESDLLTQSLKDPSLGVQFSLACHHPEWALKPTLGVGGVNGFELLARLRPGGYHTFTMLGKLARGGPMYRYKNSDIRPSGWAQTDVRKQLAASAAEEYRLSGDAILFLERLRAWCQQHRVRVAYSLPWRWTSPALLREVQARHAQFLLQIANCIPVLKDPKLGADPHPEDFADTDYHLVTRAAELRTDALAQQIMTWDLWSVDELKSLAKPY